MIIKLDTNKSKNRSTELKGGGSSTHQKRVLLRGEQALVVPPPFDEGEPARLARRVGQRVHNILK